jgi:type IV pilus assembly protein PilC
VRDVTRNRYDGRLWEQANENLGRGQQLSETLFESRLFPESVSQMIFSGEKAGRLGDVFGLVAEFTETEFDQAVKTSTQFIEPIMIVVMGSMIGFIAISLLLPIFSAGRVMSGN